jgi:hypothetical protein
MTSRPGQTYTKRPGQQMTRRPGQQTNKRPGRQQMTRRPGQQTNKRPGRQQMTRRPGQQNTKRPGRQQMTNRPGQTYTKRPGQQMTRRPGRMAQPNNKNGSFTRGPVATTRAGRRNPPGSTATVTQGLAVRRPVRNVNTNVNTNVNVNNNNNNNYAYAQPVYSNNSRSYCPPSYYSDYYTPVIYNDYCVRRRYRRYRSCANVFLSLGFFLTRPYSYYDYNRVGYNSPIIYGDDNYYAPAPAPVTEGGPQPDAITSDGEVAVAPTQPSLTTPEARMLAEVAKYVEGRSVEGQYRISDAAFSSEVWLLDLAQAPAVFELQTGLYSVVAGFEGTLGTSNVPSNVNVEFFVAKTANGYEVRDAWITSANGIARNKLYQSPVYPDVKTWEADKKCPFTGQPMVPIPPTTTTEHG